MARSLFAFLITVSSICSLADEARTPLAWVPLKVPGCGGRITSITISPHDSNRILVGGDVMGIFLSKDAGKTWEACEGLRSWEVADLTWHPSEPETIWAGTMSGPYVSKDGGKTWEEKRMGFPKHGLHHFTAPIQKVMIDPTEERHLLAYGGSRRGWYSSGNPMWGAVWESDDDGESWVQLCTITKDGFSVEPEAHGVNVVGVVSAPKLFAIQYVIVRGEGTYESTDAGKTWIKRTSKLPSTELETIATHPTIPDRLWVTFAASKAEGAKTYMAGGVLYSSKGGASWQLLNKGLLTNAGSKQAETSSFTAIAVAPSNPKIVYTCDNSQYRGIIYKSTNGGVDWVPVGTKAGLGEKQDDALKKLPQVSKCYPGGLSFTVLVVDPKNPDIVYGGGHESLLKSIDGGKTWEDISATKSTDGWQGNGLCGITATNIVFNPARKGQALLLGRGAAKAWESIDGFKTWIPRGQTPWAWGGGNDACFAGTYTYITTGESNTHPSIVISADMGKTWTAAHGKEFGLPQFTGRGVATGVYALPTDPTKVWAVVSGRLFGSTDGGKKWTQVFWGRGLQWIAGDPARPARFYVSGRRNTYMTNNGKSFVAIGGPKTAGKLHCDTKGRLYMAARHAQRAGLWRFANGGWERIFDEDYVTDVSVDPTDPARIAVITGDQPYQDLSSASGVWLSSDGGKTWACPEEQRVMYRGSSIAFNLHNPEELLIGTQGQGFYTMQWPKTVVLTGYRRYTMTDYDRRYSVVAYERKPRRLPPTVATNPNNPQTQPADDPDELPNPFRNGNMEVGGGMPSYWTSKWVGSGNISVAKSSTDAHGGRSSLLIHTNGGKGKGQIAQIVNAGSIQHIEMSGFIKADIKGYATVAIQSFDARWKTLQYRKTTVVSGKSDWKKFSGRTKLPRGTVKIGISFLIEGNGKALLDDITVKVKE